MHYREHCLTVSVVYVTMLMYSSTNDVLITRGSIRQKQNCLSLVQFSYVAEYATLQHGSIACHVRPSVRPSVCRPHSAILSKRCMLWLQHIHRYLLEKL